MAKGLGWIMDVLAMHIDCTRLVYFMTYSVLCCNATCVQIHILFPEDIRDHLHMNSTTLLLQTRRKLQKS